MPNLTGDRPAKQPLYISRKDGLPLTFAGLWESWKDGMLSFTILTTDASDGLHDLHTRMPVIMDADGMQAWSLASRRCSRRTSTRPCNFTRCRRK